ncbi:MAG: hypothetical protein DCF20_05265 [Pseudanabaena sp.]|nr:MAG: hypothetical protein DCF20_05265 [Pseudanabaena sp.]
MANDANAAEVNIGEVVNAGQFTLTRTGNTSAALITYYTISGTATNTSDYSTLSRNVTFAAGSATAVVDINVVNDVVFEGNENVVLTLAANAAYNLGLDKSSTVTITDNDLPTVTIAATDAASAEVIAGQVLNPGRFTLTRTGSTASTLTVDYTVAGTATNGIDYSNLSGSVTFAAGANKAFVDVNVIDDADFEGAETVVLNLANNAAYTLGTAKTSTVTIADNDKPTVTIVANDAIAAEVLTGQTPNLGQVTFTRTGNTSAALTTYYTIGGTATKGIDYSSLFGTVTFAAGSNTAVVNINAIDDVIIEGTETIVLTLAANAAYNLGTTASATVAIADNDLAPFAVDFNRNGTSDILWQKNDRTQLSYWDVISGKVVSVDLGVTDPNWSIVGTGDFNKDGVTDILWQKNDRTQLSFWDVSSGKVASVDLGVTDPDWSIVGTGDFNKDGVTDILWQKNDRTQLSYWNVSSGKVASVNLGVTDPNWSIAGTGDFNKDGVTDILWQKNDRTQLGYWKMGGSSVVSVDLGVTDPNRLIVGTGDFNKDGFADILWRKNDRIELGYWKISGGKINGVSLGVSDPNWTILGTGDYNKDGITDILWQKNDRTQLDYLDLSSGKPVSFNLTNVTDSNQSVVSNINRTYLVYDSIVREYNLYGNVGGFLGAILGDSWVDNGRTFQKFAGGMIGYYPGADGKPTQTYVFSNASWNQYQTLGNSGVGSLLGVPTTDISDIGNGNFIQHFTNGRIVTTSTGTYFVYELDREYVRLGNVTSFLGVPLENASVLPDGRIIQHFAGGVIGYYPGATGKPSQTYVFSNASWNQYQALGNSGVGSLLGVPTTDITDIGNGNFIQNFAYGRIVTTPTGTYFVYELDYEYVRLGNVTSFLGVPLENASVLPDGRVIQRFEGGVIGYYPGATGKPSQTYVFSNASWNKYQALGNSGVGSLLGVPTTDITDIGNGNFIQNFTNGRIITTKTGTYYVNGYIGGEYSGVGNVNSFLGVPTSDSYDGSNGSIIQNFAGGVIAYLPTATAKASRTFVFSNDTWSKYQALGDVNGPLKEPSTNITDIGGGNYLQDFANGRIITTKTGTYYVNGYIGGEYSGVDNVNSFLGVPTSDSYAGSNGSIIQNFVGGVIAYLPTATAKASRTFVFSNDTWSKYQALGDVNGPLKEPSTNITDIGGGNYLQDFANGRIITTKTGTYYVNGYIGGEYSGFGNVTGFLGVPLGDSYDGSNGSIIQNFAGGVIAYLPTATAKASKTFVFSNDTWSKYQALGDVNGTLKEPSSDITDIGGGNYLQNFVNGFIIVTKRGTYYASLSDSWVDDGRTFVRFADGMLGYYPGATGKTSQTYVFSNASWNQYQALGNSGGLLGVPTTDIADIGNGNFIQHFANGRIVTTTTGTYFVYELDREYVRLGNVTGFLGLPLENASVLADGRVVQRFAGGVLGYYPEATGKPSQTYVFSNASWNQYQALGNSGGLLGVPTTDIADIGNGNFIQHFANGRIVTTTTGTYFVYELDREYVRLGNVTSFLGVPLENAFTLADGRVIQRFVGGVIGYYPGANGKTSQTYVFSNASWNQYQALGNSGEGSVLGVPTTDITDIGNGNFVQKFANGVIAYATANASRTFVFSDASWQVYNGNSDLLGLPTSNITELSTKEGWIQSFEKGSLYMDRNGSSEIFDLHDPAARQLAKQVQNGNNKDLDTAIRVAEALRKVGYNVRVIADALANTFTFVSDPQQVYVLMTYGLSISGLGLNTRQIADLLFDEGATIINIAQSFHYYGYGLDKLADALKNGLTKFKGIGLTYNEIALGILSSGYKVDERALSDLLTKQGASLQDVSNALQFSRAALRDLLTKQGASPQDIISKALQDDYKQTKDLGEFADLLADLGLGGEQILSVLKTINTDLVEVTKALKSITITKDDNSVSALNPAQITNILFEFQYNKSQGSADQIALLLKNIQVSEAEVVQALKSVVGINDVPTLVSIIKKTFTNLQAVQQDVNVYISIAKYLWNNDISANNNANKIAYALWNLGASSTNTAEAIFKTINSLKGSNTDSVRQAVARALNAQGYTDDGAQGYEQWDVAQGIWDTFHTKESRGMTRYQFANVLLKEGFHYGEVFEMVGKITGNSPESWWAGLTTVVKAAISDIWNQITGTVSQLSAPLGKEILSVAYKIPIFGTVVGGIESAINAFKGDNKGALISSINTGLATFGLSTVITPKIVDFIVDVGWELKEGNLKGAIASALDTFGVEKTTSKVVVEVIKNAPIGDTSGIFKTTLTATDFDELLEFDPQETTAFFNLANSVKDGNFAGAADILVAWNPSISQSASWVQQLKDGMPENDRQALQQGLSAIGLQDQSAKLTNAIFDYKDKDYTNALAIALSLSKIQGVQALAQVASELMNPNPNYTNVFKNALGLVEGGQSLGEAFEYLRNLDVKNFIKSMVDAAPILIKFIY